MLPLEAPIISALLLLLPLHTRRNVLLSLSSTTTATLSITAFDRSGPDIEATDNSNANRYGTRITMKSLELAAESRTLGPMAIYPDPILRRSASPVTQFGPAVNKVAEVLIDGMKTNSTTAIQYGIDARMIILKGSASPLQSGAPLVLINPTVLSRSGEDKMVPWIEYCSDIPLKNGGDLLEVELLRDELVEVAAQDLRGLPIRRALRGESARAFQHELDHLGGLLIVDHAGLEELPQAIAEGEAPYHKVRQRQAFERKVYQGNEPLYR
uniref:Peptide deformylase n=1 Tax=Pseudictyota dubia TaxID=2749911 RepID=A0A7R9ZG23_9STRA